MSNANQDDLSFQTLLAECLEKLERGEELERDQLLRAYPQHAAELDEFLSNQDMFRRVAKSLQQGPAGAVEETIDSGAGGGEGHDGDTIRYVGEYEILDEIARGGMGVVYKARQRNLKRIVAVKMILSGQLAGSADVERFQREARAAGRLQHPNIVAIHEVGEHDGHHYFAMDYVDGHGLSDEIRDEALSPNRAARIVRQVAGAVHFAHQQGTLHRDLKPANILIDAEDKTHVTDFGLAKILGDDAEDNDQQDLTASGQVLGTPGYMSPEQAAARHNLVGPAADVYSLGAVLYACLTGRAPFVADSTVDTLLQVIHQEPVRPATLNPSVPKDLETICLKCLEKEPHKRYGTAALLGEDLSNFMEGRPVQARPIGRAQRGWRWCRRNPLVASLLSLLALSLVLGLAVSSSLAVLADSRAQEEARQRGLAENASRKSQRLQQQAEKLAAEATAAQTQAERQVYAMRIADSFLSLQSSRVPSAWSALDRSRWDLRGWEHDFLHTQLTRGRALRGHTRTVEFVAFAEGGRQLVSASSDRTLRTWNVAKGRLATTTSTALRISAAAGTPAGVLAVGDHRVVELWDLADMRRVMTTSGSRRLYATDVALSDDGTQLAVATGWPEGKVQLCDAASGEPLWSHATGAGALSVCCSPDGEQVAAGLENGKLLIWSAESGEEQLQLEAAPQAIHAVQFDFAGERLVSAGGDGLIRVWDVGSGSMLRVMSGHEGGVLSLAISRRGRRLVSGGEDGAVRVWDLSTGEPLTLHRGHLGAVGSVAISPDQQQVASGGADGVVRLWPALPEHHELQREDPVRIIAVSSDGQRLAVDGPEGSVEVWDRRRRSRLCQFNAHASAIRSLAFSPDGQRLVTAGGYAGRDGVVRVWKANTGEELLSLEGHRVAVRSVVYSNDGRWIVSGGGEYRRRSGEQEKRPGEWRVWNAETGAERLAVGDIDGIVTAVAVSPDGKHVATAGDQVRLWDAASGRQIFARRHQLRPTAENTSVGLSFSPDGANLASASHHGGLQVWDTQSGESVAVLDGHERPATAVLFGTQGRRLFSSSRDQTVRVWDVTAGNSLLTLTGHQDEVHSLALSPDGTLLSGSKDGAVRQWRVGRPQRFLPLRAYADGKLGVTLDRSRTRLATYGDDAPVMIWDLTTGRKLQQGSFQTARNARAVFHDQGLTVAWAQGPWDGVNQLYLRAITDDRRTVVAEVESKVRTLDLSHDAARLACGGEDGKVLLFDVATGDRRTLSSTTSPAVKIAFSNGGGLLAVGRDDGTVQWWRVARDAGQPGSEGAASMTVKPRAAQPVTDAADASSSAAPSSDSDDNHAVAALSFSPDESHLAVAFQDGVVEARHTKTGELLFQRELTGALVHRLAYSHDATKIACSTEQGKIHLLDATSGRSLSTLEGHHGPVFAAVFGGSGALHSVASDTRREFRDGILLDLITRSEYRQWSVGP